MVINIRRLLLYLLVLLTIDIPSPYVLMRRPIMSLPSRNPITITLRSLPLMNVSAGGIFCLLGFKVIWLVKVILGSQAALGLGTVASSSRTHEVGPTTSGAFSTSCGSPAIGIVCVVKIVEVIKHEIHIFGLLTLKMVNDPLVFMHFYSNVSISLSRYSPWLDEVTWSQGVGILLIGVHIVTTLSGGDITRMMVLMLLLIIVLQFLPTPDGLIVEVF